MNLEGIISLATSSPKNIFGLVLIILGLVTLLLVLKWSLRGINLKTKGEKTFGQVVEYKVFSEQNRNKGKALIVEVEIQSDKFKFTSASYWITPPYAIGSKVPILCRRMQGAPSSWDAALDSFEELFSSSIMIGGVSLALIAMGSLVIFSTPA
jgi:hypothetical protein